MKSILKNIMTCMGNNLEDYVPEISGNFHLLVDLRIGPESQEGGHDYSLGICTPTWLDHSIQNVGPIWGRHLLVVNSFNAKEIKTAIQKIIEKCDKNDFAETSVVLARYFQWEFEDYKS